MRRLLVLAACLLSSAARAQLDLPGATAPTSAGTVQAPRIAPPRVKAHTVRPAAAPVSGPAEAVLGGKTLALNGGKSQIGFTAKGKTVEVSRLLLAGHKVSNGRDECQVDVAGMPLALTPLGRTNGVARFSVAVPACPFSFEVLNGAVLTSADVATCAFPATDCQASVVGLWGPQPGEIGPDQVKTIERERTVAERAVLEDYKGLVHATKDRAAIRDYASDQAGFSSHREEVCRDYIGESRHGFCASRLTQARAATLGAELVVAQAAKEERRRKHAEHGKKP